MHVLMINTSPHRQGCTNRALLEIASTLEKQGISSEILWIGTEALHGCIDCGYCFNHGRCVFGDDKVNEAAEKAIASDALILGAPVHYASIAGSGSAFLDRLFRVISRQMALKPGASVVSCRRGGASASFDQLNKYFTISGMPVVSSTYWNSVHGNTVEEVEQDLEGLQVMRNLGSSLAWLLASIEAGNVQRPRLEREHYTNFIR
ncbi:MAG: flavodoxin family protein [Sphaerochaeta sp.]|jgi:multimeric flavodoxin WrbA|nr:flavodoxin family protein [Sphaerochaeta sp.]NCC13034.1 flavodoxin family protein [Spirochaetia bacterium]NCC90107.1 flavodoxin family protein [Spirochaetia bacterium]